MKVVIVSGFFNPMHTGHLDYIKAAKKLGTYLVVIVNNDEQVKIKGSTPFMSEEDRLKVVRSNRDVNKAILSIDSDHSVIETLKREHKWYSIDPLVESITFANGGDRTVGNSPEEEYCKKAGVRTAYGVGGGKTQSSSNLISQADKTIVESWKSHVVRKLNDSLYAFCLFDKDKELILIRTGNKIHIERESVKFGCCIQEELEAL